ncbi:diguanylate cyclase [Marinobacteraceae bacterium S3BR75-40.1]
MPQQQSNEKPISHPIDEQTLSAQRLRIRRLGMSVLSLLVTFTIVVFCWYQDMIPGSVVVVYALLALLLNAGFYGMFKTHLNLRFREPSLTAPQMVLSLLPPLFVMYFLEPGQARAIFMLIAVVPGLYGILALRTGAFAVVASLFFGLYAALVTVLWLFKPEVLNGPLEWLQLVAFALVLAELAVIGGYISGLRDKLRERNDELQEALQRISELASRDELTGTFNRRYLLQALDRETNRFNRASGPFSLCILDIDYFKSVNDTYGHQAGDAVLRQMAHTVSEGLRNIDCFGRYGGEEFLLVLPQTPLEGALIKAERVRRAIAGMTVKELPGGFQVTVSIGVSQFRPGEAVDDTIARADQGLYLAKERGRNQVVAEDDPALEDSQLSSSPAISD